MGIAAGTVWEVRSTGNDANGGLYLSTQSGAGPDISQSDTPALSLSDVVTNGSTTVTSVAGGFTSAMIGNGINIAGVPYMIVTRSTTNTITVDRTIGAAIGQTGNVGGALATPGFCSGQATAANKIWIKAGTYTLTSSTPNIAGGLIEPAGGSAAFPFVIEGYQTTRGDKGTKPVITDAAGGFNNIVTISAYCIFDNIACISASQGFTMFTGPARCIRCKASGAGAGFVATASGVEFIFCEGATTGTGTPFLTSVGEVTYFGCVSHGSGVSGFLTSASDVNCLYCISYANATGFDGGAALHVQYKNCTAYGNSGDGFRVSNAGAATINSAINCLSVGNGTFGFDSASAAGFFALINCATQGNGAATNNITNTEGMVVLSGDPFVNAAAGNFALNNTAGRGAACRAGGVPGAFPGGLSTGFIDIGAVQHQDPGGTTPVLTVLQVGSTAVLTWTATVGAVHYIVLRTNTDPTLSTPVWTELSIVDSPTLTYTDSTPSSPSYYTLAPIAF